MPSRRRDVGGTWLGTGLVSPEGSRWHPARSGDGVRRREVVGTTQEKEHEWHMAGSPGEGMWVALGWDWGRVERREVADAISEKGHG